MGGVGATTGTGASEVLEHRLGRVERKVSGLGTKVAGIGATV